MIKIISDKQPAAPKTLSQLKPGDVFRFTDCTCGLLMVCQIPGTVWRTTYVGLETAIVSTMDNWRPASERPVVLYTTAELRVAQ